METKICTNCAQEKSLDQFHKKNDSYNSQCKDCRNAYSKQHYQSNKTTYINRARVHSQKETIRTRTKFWEYKNSCKCIDCGESNPIVLQFDHITNKKYNISSMVNGKYSWKKILEEINKCEVVCANCHLIRTAKQFNYYNRIMQKSETDI